MTDVEDYIEKFTKEFAKKEFDVDVEIEFINTFRLLGICYPHKDVVRFSKPFIEANKNNKKVLEALSIHECCHLRHINHRGGFKKLCGKYGIATHTRDEKDVVMPKLKKYYLYKCSRCGKEVKRMRYRAKEGACKECCDKYNNGRYDKKYKFKLVGWVDENENSM